MNNEIDVQICGANGIVPCTYKTVVLKPNIVDDKNILTQAMMNKPNTKYVIKYDFIISDNIVTKSVNVVSTNVSQCGNAAYAQALADYNAAHEAWIEADNAYTNNPNDTTLAAKNAAYAALEAAQLTLNGTPQYYYFAGTAINLKKNQHITIPEGCVLLNSTLNGVVDFTLAPNDMTVYIGSAVTGTYEYTIQAGIEMPANCLIEFDGGTISNGTIVFDDTILIYDQQEEDVLKNITTIGNYEVSAGGKGDKKDNINGMGKIYLKKNRGFAEQLTQDNTIYVIQYDFDLDGGNVTVPENCILEFDGGSISNGTIAGTQLSVYGNGTKLENIHLIVSGNKNILRDFTIFRTNKSERGRMNYWNTSLAVGGKYNKLINIESYNQDGPGLSVSGIGHVIDKIYSHDNITGMIVGNTTRDLTIINSRFVYNNAATGSGTDGVLFQRTASGIKVDNCEFSYNSEHGIYFQGQNAIFTNNFFKGNKNHGLKFGSYDDGGYTYDGEKLDCWVPGSEGIPGYNGVIGANGYGIKNVIIENNIFEQQETESGNGVYFQPSACNITINNNTFNSAGIKIVYFNYGTRLEALKDIIISNNILDDCDINVAAYDSLQIFNNVCKDILTNCQNATTPPYLTSKAHGVFITGNVCHFISTQRADTPKIANNICEDIITSTNMNSMIITGNKINACSSKYSIIKDFSHNDVIMSAGVPFFNSSVSVSLPKKFVGNRIISTVQCDTDNFISMSNNDAYQDNIFEHNYIECLSYFAMVIYGKNHRITDNTIINKRESSIGNILRVYGQGHIITNNVFKPANSGYGIQVDSQSSRNIIKNNVTNINGLGQLYIEQDNINYDTLLPCYYGHAFIYNITTSTNNATLKINNYRRCIFTVGNVSSSINFTGTPIFDTSELKIGEEFVVINASEKTINLKKDNSSNHTGIFNDEVENSSFDLKPYQVTKFVKKSDGLYVVHNSKNDYTPCQRHYAENKLYIFAKHFHETDISTGITTFNSTKGRPVWGNQIRQCWVDADGRKINALYGIASVRPSNLDENDIGYMFFDTSLGTTGKPIWWDGTQWVDATGATV